VRHFEETRPTLHDIFIRIAGPGAQEALQATEQAAATEPA
jgi:hypothetical protein